MGQYTLCQDVLVTLEIGVLRRLGPYNYQVVEPVPDFFMHLYRHELTDPQTRRHPWLVYPMLEFFLMQAEPFWALNSRGRLVIGPWVETDSRGVDFPLQALAICTQERQIMLIEHLGLDYHKQQRYLQQAHEALLQVEAAGK